MRVQITTIVSSVRLYTVAALDQDPNVGDEVRVGGHDFTVAKRRWEDRQPHDLELLCFPPAGITDQDLIQDGWIVIPSE